MKKVIVVLLIILVIIMALIFGYIILNKGSEEENTVNQNKVENINNVENEDLDNDIENNETDQNVEIPENITVVKEVLPTGFMGSSFYKVVLYSNKNVYLETYDGDRDEKSNLLSRTLIAENVDTIEMGEEGEHYGEAIIKGGTVKNDSIGWIIFE